MSDDDAIGTGGYRHRGAASRASVVFAALKRKAALRAALEMESAKIAAALPNLTPEDHAELRGLMAAEDAAIDADVAALQIEADRLAREAAADRQSKAISVALSKTASRILADEIQRRLERGHCPPVELLTEQAIRAAFGGAS